MPFGTFIELINGECSKIFLFAHIARSQCHCAVAIKSQVCIIPFWTVWSHELGSRLFVRSIVCSFIHTLTVFVLLNVESHECVSVCKQMACALHGSLKHQKLIPKSYEPSTDGTTEAFQLHSKFSFTGHKLHKKVSI